jgi:hypothetical protein
MVGMDDSAADCVALLDRHPKRVAGLLMDEGLVPAVATASG